MLLTLQNKTRTQTHTHGKLMISLMLLPHRHRRRHARITDRLSRHVYGTDTRDARSGCVLGRRVAAVQSGKYRTLCMRECCAVHVPCVCVHDMAPQARPSHRYELIEKGCSNGSSFAASINRRPSPRGLATAVWFIENRFKGASTSILRQNKQTHEFRTFQV